MAAALAALVSLNAQIAVMTDADANHQRADPRGERPSTAALAATALRLGAIAFGGLGAIIALLDRELVVRRRWIGSRDLSDALAFTKPLPGSTAIQVVGFIGYRLCGWRGAVAAGAAFVAPAAVLMCAAAAGTASLPTTGVASGALTGVQVVVVGLLAAAMWRLARSEARGSALTGVLTAGFVLGLVVNAALVVVGAGLLGALTTREGRDA